MNRITNLKIKKNKRNKINRIILMLLILCLIIFIILSFFNKTEANINKKIVVKKYNVSQGETLWSIAKIEQINNDYYKGKSIQEIINEIRFINNLQNDSLYINQTIYIGIN